MMSHEKCQDLLIGPFLFAHKVIRHNPPLPGLPVHALPDLKHDQTDHNAKPMEHWCIATVAQTICYCMTSLLCRQIEKPWGCNNPLDKICYKSSLVREGLKFLWGYKIITLGAWNFYCCVAKFGKKDR